MNDKLVKKYNDRLVKYFYDNLSDCLDDYSSITLTQAVENGLNNILDEIFEYAEDDEPFHYLVERLENSCRAYNFPDVVIKNDARI